MTDDERYEMKLLRDHIQELEQDLRAYRAPVSQDTRKQWKLLADQVRAQSKRLLEESQALRQAVKG